MLLIFEPVAQDLNRVAVTSDDFPLLRSGHHLPYWKQEDTTTDANTPETTEPSADETAGRAGLYSADDVIVFARAFIDGTALVQDQTYLDSCESVISSDFVQKAQDIQTSTVSLDVFSALYSLYDMVWSVHPLITECSQSLDTAPQTLASRFNFRDAQDVKILLTNVVHNASLVIDSARDIWAFFAEG